MKQIGSVLLMSLLIIAITMQVIICIQLFHTQNKMIMYNTSIMNFDEMNGFYSLKHKFYCVYTGGRTEELINTTDCHERCHAWIDSEEGFRHFCTKEDVEKRSK